jgi:antitoxin (DNA-binding transcriptional repressor) of toxin-antitoxin stability system
MKIGRRALALLVAAALSGGAHTVAADEAAALTGEIQTMDASATTKGSGAVTGKIAADFQSFAGSKENSTALVTGLRNGSEVTLTQTGEPAATFTPATKPMGYGNVSTSLSLAKYQLAQQGINNPTPEQLQTALNGGTITYGGKTVEYRGVLQMRADGMGWGQIAQQLGTKLGPVVSGMKVQNAHIATLPAAKHAITSTSTGATTATGASAGATAANNGRGASGGKGIVTASGASSAPGAAKGKAADGIASAGGSGASSPRGQGIVTAAGTGASPGAQGVGKAGVVTGAGGSTSISVGGGGGNGNGKAVGHTK